MGKELEKLWKTEDWWSVWMGLGIVALSLAAFWAGGSIKGWAVIPSKWSSLAGLLADTARNGWGYLVIFVLFAAAFTFSMAIMGRSVRTFLPGFLLLFLGALLIFVAAGWKVMEEFNVEAPLLALIVGLLVSNALPLPAWFRECLLTEYYIKTGIVLLGATLPLTLIFSAGPVAFLQATLVSVTTWLTIYLAGTRLFKLEPKFGAVLGAAGAVCGVSASIAVGGAVRAKKDHISISIAVVTVWAIVMIFALTILLKFLVPGTISPGEAGAWVGNSEFADAAGFAVVAELATRFGDAPINAFTLMKVIGRDIWIGIWCLILSVVSVLYWEKGESGRLGPGIVWERFPKFVLGFFAACVLLSLVSARPPADHVGTAPWAGKYKDVGYAADFSSFAVPEAYRGRLTVNVEAKSLAYRGAMSREDLKALGAGATPDQIWALNQLQVSSNWFEGVLTPKVISPIKKLRSWAFVLCFLCIGLSTRFKELSTFGLKPFWAFSLGVLVNVPLGYLLSTVVFARFWEKF
ncbi:MAG: putative sulfate exporter family transporter [Acidobacteriota bacterium]